MKAWLIMGLCLVGCATQPPLDEYALARTALNAAQEQEAARYAPSYFHQAEEAYGRAEGYFKNNEFEQAEEEFIRSRQFAEKAENTTRIHKVKSGEVGP